jgi:hypothetical protein
MNSSSDIDDYGPIVCQIAQQVRRKPQSKTAAMLGYSGMVVKLLLMEAVMCNENLHSE